MQTIAQLTPNVWNKKCTGCFYIRYQSNTGFDTFEMKLLIMKKLGYLLLIILFKHFAEWFKKVNLYDTICSNYIVSVVPKIIMFHLTFLGQQYMSVRTK